MLDYRVAQFPPNFLKKYLQHICFKSHVFKVVTNVWAIFARKFVVKNFQKSPNLVYTELIGHRKLYFNITILQIDYEILQKSIITIL